MLRAQTFKTMRANLKMIKRECDKKEFMDMKDRLKQYEIIPYEFKTNTDRMGSNSVFQVATEREVKDIILHGNDILLRELNKHTLAANIFTEELSKSLNFLGWNTAQRFWEEYLIIPEDELNEHKFNFEVDELGLFLWLNRSTFR